MSRAKKQRAAERQTLREGKGKPGAWEGGRQPRRGREADVPLEVVVAGEIVAHRGWWVWDDPELGAVLYSMYALVPWEGPTLVANGEPRPMPPQLILGGAYPVGVHALKAAEWLGSDYRKVCHVEGEVALSGKVIVGLYGFQAERATIQRLTVRPGHVAMSKDGDHHDWRGCTAVRTPPTPHRLNHITWTYGTIGNQPWPDTLSMYRAAEELAARYQCEVEIGAPA